MLISAQDTLWILAMICIVLAAIIFIIKAAKGDGTSKIGYYLLVIVSFIGISGIVLKGLDMGGVLEGLSKEFTWTLYIATPVLVILLLCASLCIADDYYLQKKRNESLKKIEKSLAYYAHNGSLYEKLDEIQEKLATAEKDILELVEATTNPTLLSA